MVISIHMAKSKLLLILYFSVLQISFYKSRSRYRYIIIYLIEKPKMTRVVIKTAWLSLINFKGRPNNEFFQTNDKTKAQVLKLRKDLVIQKQTETLHHILPGNQIIKIMENCVSQKQEQLKKQKTCDLLSNHCNNHPAIRDKVQGYIQISQFKAAMESCWSSVFWFRKNLVLGPLSNRRSDDPGGNFDQPLFDQQSNNYKEIMQNSRLQILNKRWNEALEFFLKLTPTNNVIWKYDEKKNQWSVAGKSKLPGNLGFDY